MITRLLKITITLAVLAYVGLKLMSEGVDVFQDIWEFSIDQYFFLAISLALMPLNWGLETVKWKKSLQSFYPELTFQTAWSGVWAGLATGIFTPNRLGEYAGRIAFLPSGHRVEAAIYLFADRFCQLIITVWAGWLGIEWMLAFQRDLFLNLISGYSWIIPWISWSCRTIGILLLMLLLFPPKRLPLNLLGERFKPWLIKAQNAVGKLDARLLWLLLGLSASRYLIFSAQYLMLMNAFGCDVSVIMALALVSIVFLIKSLIPGIALTELGIRESIALYVMGIAGMTAATAFSSTFFLYVINLLIPSLIGLIFVNKIRRI